MLWSRQPAEMMGKFYVAGVKNPVLWIQHETGLEMTADIVTIAARIPSLSDVWEDIREQIG